MTNIDTYRVRALPVILLAAFGTASAAAQTGSTPVPKATVVPATKDSVPFLEWDRTLRPVDLKKAGYTEQEFLVSGTANVYDWAPDGTVSIRTPNVPYTTRILLRIPADRAHFSGNVVVEPMNEARRYDWPMMWGYLGDEIVSRGDAWVGVTMPAGIIGLQKFDPKRYAAVSYANPTPTPCKAGEKPGADTALMWDALSQVGALLKSKTADRPLAGYNVQYVYMTAQSAPLDYIQTYVNAIHPHAKLADGKFVYDGYLIKHAGGAHGLSACAPTPPDGDPRHVTKDAGVPVIAITAQGEVVLSLNARRADSDEPNDRYRLYEVSAGAHLDKYAYSSMPSLQDAGAAGNAQGTADWPFRDRCEPEILSPENPLAIYLFRSALNNLDLWVRKGMPPPRAERMTVKDVGTKNVSVVTDQYGAGLGGVRTFYVDIPVANFSSGVPGPGLCSTQAHMTPFEWGTLDGMYGSYKNYVGKVMAAVDKAVQERWFTEADGKKIKADLAATRPPRVVQ